MTREGLGLNEVRSQLIEDMFSYRTHADYKVFVAFIYDPKRKIENPGGVINDLEKEMSTDVYKVKEESLLVAVIPTTFFIGCVDESNKCKGK
jgi:DpnII restriction endonuclease